MTSLLPEIVGVEDVMARYGLRDRRSARRLMDEAGSFFICGRLVVRREDLLAHEEALRADRRRHGGDAASPPAARPTPRGVGHLASEAPALRPGWWRDAPDGGRDAA